MDNYPNNNRPTGSGAGRILGGIFGAILGFIGFIWGITALAFVAVAFIPFLGWLNWIAVPFAFPGIVISSIGLVNPDTRGFATVGVVINSAAVGIGIFRLHLGFGVI